MKANRQSNRATFFMSMLAAILLCASAGIAYSQVPSSAVQSAALKQRAIRPKPIRTLLSGRVRSDVVVVKFREGTRVRERLGVLESNLTNLSPRDEQLLGRANLARQRIFQDLAEVNNLIGSNSKRRVKKLFTRSEAELDAEKSEGEARISEELADLNLYHLLQIADADPRETERLIDQLNALESVEIAYAQPTAEEAQVDIAPTTPNFTGQQGYMSPAAGPTSTTNGIDALYARLFPGGRGNDVNIIDIERGWNLTHEDMPPMFHQSGPMRPGSRQHGTAVLGVLAAGDNGYGVTGIVPQSRIGVASALAEDCGIFSCSLVPDFENSVNRAAGQLRFGDVLVIEQHSLGPDSGGTAPCNADQFEFVPMEFWDANFDAIKNATAKGIIVVAAAGNGSMDLDSPIYNGKFDRSVRDSGAILVAGGTSTGRAPMCWTNFGSRIDLQGWGEDVATLGRGDIRVNGSDENQWYTDSFDGTSSATPVVAGAAASLQGFRKARGLGAFTSSQMRAFLRSTGVAQANDPRLIGPLPNLRAAIDAHAPKRTLKITFLSIKVVDNLFAGPHQLAFNFTVNNKFGQYPAGGYTASYPQGVSVNLPANFSFTTTEVLNEGLTIFVSSRLRSIITFDPKTGMVTNVKSRPVHSLRWFPTGTSYTSSPYVIFGSKVFTDRSIDAQGYFEVTYRVEQVLQFTTFAF